MKDCIDHFCMVSHIVCAFIGEMYIVILDNSSLKHNVEKVIFFKYIFHKLNS